MPSIANSELSLMNLIWDHAPVGSTQLVRLAADTLGWKKSTTYTMLKKLCEKGFAQNEGGAVTARIPRQEVQAEESEHFVEQTFGGSLPGFLAAFLGGKTISAREAEELKQLIDRYRED